MQIQNQASQIYSINGPVIRATASHLFTMKEMVYVGHDRLIGEVIHIQNELAVIQAYENTSGLKTGDPVYCSGAPLSVTLGPGILNNIFDGIERPLKALEEISGSFIIKGAHVSRLDKERTWEVTVLSKQGDRLMPGDVYATCAETPLIVHKILTPPGISGVVTSVKPSGSYHINDEIMRITDDKGHEAPLTLCHEWPIKTPRPIHSRIPSQTPLITGQRVIDTLFPIAKGGAAAIPGGFGTGKTMTQHQLAKWCDADIIVYVGCGERGNEMSQVLEEFSALIDPASGRPLTDRTVLIANTSNMPVAAREASIYTGITLAEYYRDMGYHVAIMADSTSRWAEALREISGRLEEMPAEEGFPAYLPSRLSEFYERAGYVQTLGREEGSVTIIGAVSPQGSDFSEPVTQNTKRFTRCFWALDKSLAYERHYPSINWNDSYSEYIPDLTAFYNKNLGQEFLRCRNELVQILHEESKLMEIVKLIGSDVLPDDQKLLIEIARVIRVGFLQQNAFHPQDTFVPLEKQLKMMRIILYLYHSCKELLTEAVTLSDILGPHAATPNLFEKIVKIKYEIPNDHLERFEQYHEWIDEALSGLKERRTRH